MSISKLVLPSLGTIWGAIGFKRGADLYTYDLKRRNEENTFMYVNQISHGLFGTFAYINPLFIFFTIPKEFYRLEVNIRNLPRNDYYYQII